MPTVTFDAVAEGRVITIPAEYVGKISCVVSVTAVSHTPDPTEACIAAFDAHMETIREERRQRPASIDDFNDDIAKRERAYQLLDAYPCMTSVQIMTRLVQHIRPCQTAWRPEHGDPLDTSIRHFFIYSCVPS